jgi:tetratricopeptide (TPR) repeat protein
MSRHVHLDDLAEISLDELTWHPVRRALGVTGFGVNAWSAKMPGDALIERHDETSTGAGGHEELYLVLSGRAAFTVDGEPVDAPAGAFVLVDPGETREAVAAEPDTVVLAIGGRPGAVLPVSPFEHYYAAQPAYQAGDYDRAIEIASAGLADHPDHPLIHYQLACYHALAGRLDEARASLEIAFAGDERTRAWAADDDDLAALR